MFIPKQDDTYELTDAEKNNVNASLQPNPDSLKLFASQGFDAGMEFAMSSLIVATFRRITVPAARQEFLGRCLAGAAKIHPDLF